VKVHQAIRLIEANGWRFVRQRGSHRTFRHPTKAGSVTIAGRFGSDIPTGTLGSILEQAGLKGGKQ
jgi:predicted RNA binding protein YcfA (HicA-like mRNA interferase family)